MPAFPKHLQLAAPAGQAPTEILMGRRHAYPCHFTPAIATELKQLALIADGCRKVAYHGRRVTWGGHYYSVEIELDWDVAPI